MYLKSLLAFLILGVSSVFAASNEVEKDFIVKESPDVVSKWLLANPDKIVESTGSKLISRKDGLVRVRKQTSKGDYEFTIRETTKITATTTLYVTKLVEVHEGDIVSHTNKITLTPTNKGTKVVIYMFVDVKNKRVTPLDIHVTLSKSANGFERMLKSKF